MAADSYSSLLGTLLMGTGNDNNNWGVNLNNSVFQIFEDAIAGVLTSSVTGGTLDLSTPAPPNAASLARYSVLAFTGTLSSTQTIIVPALSKLWMVTNGTSGDIFMQTPSGTLTNIPMGTRKIVICNSSGVYRQDGADVGKVEMFAGQTVPAGSLECDNSLVLRASYPELFGQIGTIYGSTDTTNFRLPPGTDTGRFPRSRKAGTDDSGATYANQVGSHTHTGSVTISGNTGSAGDHTHTASSSVIDPGHAHTYSAAFIPENQTSAGPNPAGGDQGTYSTAYATTGISVSTSIAAVGGHTHSISGTGTFTTDATGGTEVRPEAVVYRFCIRY